MGGPRYIVQKGKDSSEGRKFVCKMYVQLKALVEFLTESVTVMECERQSATLERLVRPLLWAAKPAISRRVVRYINWYFSKYRVDTNDMCRSSFSL
jgi:hypothetical protein